MSPFQIYCIYNLYVEITFDVAKDAINQRKHGISLGRAEEFDFDAANYEIDDSQNYGEVRFLALGFLDARLYSLTFTTDGAIIRAISLRKATKHEEGKYSEA
jgi:uncharacterized DUF497 family protein